MLPYALAIAVGLSSSFLFFTAFFFKDIHRPDDFFWSTIGLFYALVLWFCATGITGAVLLGQLAAVALLTAFIWQTIKLRDALANPEKQANLDNFSVVKFLKQRFLRSPVLVKPTPQESEPETKTATTETVTPPPQVETKAQEPETTAIVETPTPKETEALTVPEPAKTSTVATAQSSASVPESAATTLKSNAEQAEAQAESTDNSEAVTKTEETVNPEVVPPEDNTITTTEIAVEKVTIVEEETNWDDEVDDIPAASVTVIEEVEEVERPSIDAKTEQPTDLKKPESEAD